MAAARESRWGSEGGDPAGESVCAGSTGWSKNMGGSDPAADGGRGLVEAGSQ